MKNKKNLKSIIISAVIFALMVACFAGIGIIEVSAANDVAKIGNVAYTSFEDAFAAAQSGETVVALADSDEELEIPEGVIFDGGEFTFSGDVYNYGTIKSGNFSGRVDNCATISGGKFSVYVYNHFAYTISGGKFNCDVYNFGTIESGEFSGEVDNAGKIYGGTFNDKLMNSGSIINIPSDEYTLAVGEGFVYKAEDGASVTCDDHIGGEATCTEQAKCALCGEGYVEALGHTAPDENGKCENCGNVMAARIGDVYYAYFGDAFTAVRSVETVVALAGSDSALEVPEGVTFNGGEFTFGGAIYNYGTISAGTFSGFVHNMGSAEVNGGAFTYIFYNDGTISGGNFTCGLTNDGTISGGTFSSCGYNGGTISGGEFSGDVGNEGTINGGTFNDRVNNEGTISDGEFSEIVENDGTVYGGTFNDSVYNKGTVYGGVLGGKLKNYSSVINDADDEYTLVFGENFSYQAEEGASITCDAHFGGEATCAEQAKCTFCGEGYGEKPAHTDTNKDHTCEACGDSDVNMDSHLDGEDENHLCDYGCGKVADDGCYDTVVDGKCDECGEIDPNYTPGTEAPGTEAPGTEAPGTEAPGTEAPQTPNDNDGLSTGAVVGVGAGSAVVLGGGGFSLFWFVIKKKTWAELLASFKK